MSYVCQTDYNVGHTGCHVEPMYSSSTRQLYKKYGVQSVFGEFKGFSILATSQTFIDDCQPESS